MGAEFSHLCGILIVVGKLCGIFIGVDSFLAF